MFGKKNERIHELEMENSWLEFEKSILRLDLTTARRQRDSAERAAKTAIDANEEFARLHAKDQTEIRELKADIAEQVRINRVYAQEIGNQREEINRLMVIDTSRYFKTDSYLTFSGDKPEPIKFEGEPIKFEGEPEPSRIFEDQLAKRDKTIKRLKAKVKKLTSDNKAMAVEILRYRNGV